VFEPKLEPEQITQGAKCSLVETLAAPPKPNDSTEEEHIPEAVAQKEVLRVIEGLRGLIRGGGFGGGGGLDADEAAVAATILEFDVAGDEREERVVFALADVFAGLMLGAALADENRASVDELAAEALYAEPLSVRVAAVD
jgi:hypothetical protein